MDCCSSCRLRDKSQRPTDRPTRGRGNINPLKNATAALNGRTEERRTDRSAWKPVIKCELLLSLSLSLPPSLIRRLCTKVVVTCRRLPLSVQNEIPLLVLFPRSEGHCHCRCRARPPRARMGQRQPNHPTVNELESAAVSCGNSIGRLSFKICSNMSK